MLNCWDEKQSSRASFTDLRKLFDAMLSSMTSKVSLVFALEMCIINTSTPSEVNQTEGSRGVKRGRNRTNLARNLSLI